MNTEIPDQAAEIGPTLPHLNRAMRRQLGVRSAAEALEQAGGSFEELLVTLSAAQKQIDERAQLGGHWQFDSTLSHIPR